MHFPGLVRAALLAAACWLTAVLPAAAQQSVGVPHFTLRAFVNRDASLGLLYDIRIRNDDDSPLSELRIDTPGDVALSGVTAALDGAKLEDLRQPRYSRPGFEILLGRRALPPGKLARLRLEFTLERAVHAGDSGYARLELLPTAIAGQAPEDATDLTVVAHLPPGVGSEDARLDGDSATLGTFDGRTTVTWRFRAAK